MISRFAFCWLWLVLIPAVYGDLAANVFDYLIGNPRRAELHVITPEIRDGVILRLRRYAKGLHPESGAETGLGGARTAQLLLLRLGDERAMEEALKALSDAAQKHGMLLSDGSEDLVNSAQPLFIPSLAEYLFRDDGNAARREWEGDLVYDWIPVSAACALYAVHIMENSPGFTPAVTEWAKKTRHAMKLWNDDLVSYRKRDLAGFRQLMREWWRENEQFFRARNYQAVQPGRLLVQEPASAPEPTAFTGLPPPGAAQPHSAAPNTSVPIASATESVTPSGALLWAGAAIAVGLLVGLLFFRKRRA